MKLIGVRPNRIIFWSVFRIHRWFQQFKTSHRYAIYGSLIALMMLVGYGALEWFFGEKAFYWKIVYLLVSSQIAFVGGGWLIGFLEDKLKLSKNRLKEKILRTRQELKEKQAQLLHTTKLATIGELASSVAHELRQPLTIISGYCEEILYEYGDKLDKDVLDMIHRVQEQGVLMSGISGSLREFSRKEEISYELVRMRLVLEKTISFYHQQFKNRQIDLIKEIPHGLPRVMANPIQLQQVLFNLINNALDAIENLPYKRISIRAYLNKEHHLVVRVANNGPIIPEDIRQRIFSPFFSTKSADKGTGLGLSISQSIMEQHGGILRLDDKTDNQTAFLMIFPVHFAPYTPDHFEGHILIVDDNPDILLILAKKLNRLGLRCDQAADYKSAASLIDKQTYDLVFSDFNLSGKHGGHILKYLKKKQPDVPFYFISRYFGMIRQEFKQRFMEQATGYYEKPFSENKLIEILEKHLKKTPAQESDETD